MPALKSPEKRTTLTTSRTLPPPVFDCLKRSSTGRRLRHPFEVLLVTTWSERLSFASLTRAAPRRTPSAPKARRRSLDRTDHDVEHVPVRVSTDQRPVATAVVAGAGASDQPRHGSAVRLRGCPARRLRRRDRGAGSEPSDGNMLDVVDRSDRDLRRRAFGAERRPTKARPSSRTEGEPARSRCTRRTSKGWRRPLPSKIASSSRTPAAATSSRWSTSCASPATSNAGIKTVAASLPNASGHPGKGSPRNRLYKNVLEPSSTRSCSRSPGFSCGEGPGARDPGGVRDQRPAHELSHTLAVDYVVGRRT